MLASASASTYKMLGQMLKSWNLSSDVKPKLKIPMGTAVFAQNFPGWSDKSEYEGILYVLTPLDVSRDSIYRTVQKSFRHFSTDSKLT